MGGGVTAVSSNRPSEICNDPQDPPSTARRLGLGLGEAHKEHPCHVGEVAVACAIGTGAVTAAYLFPFPHCGIYIFFSGAGTALEK